MQKPDSRAAFSSAISMLSIRIDEGLKKQFDCVLQKNSNF
ncbi:hypothetical protein TREAZ_2268 [Leadbettera azotonutricia ZAS-9]|uniref:Uncharacterized protein n=1 Tax=Leadbettera azotonutricia (strain ATCC BAA-888 / DSM 13862 / ZAS-9) TaxID=545695 RepID=F5Y837_LEAAZ|nr:hypothetical protein TREAZ_2268 [Leadbettera azotonutricia ZAS-9]